MTSDARNMPEGALFPAAENASAGWLGAPAASPSHQVFLRGEVLEHALLAPARGGVWGVDGVSSYLQAFARNISEKRRGGQRGHGFVSLLDWIEFNRTWGNLGPASADLAGSGLSPHRALSASQSCVFAPLDEEEVHVFWHLFVAVLKVYAASLHSQKQVECGEVRLASDPDSSYAARSPSNDEGCAEASSNLRSLTFLTPPDDFGSTVSDLSGASPSLPGASAPGDDSGSRRGPFAAPQTALERSLATSQMGERVDLRALALLLLIQESRSVRLPLNPRSTDDPWRAPASGLPEGGRDSSGGGSPGGTSALASGGARGESPRYLSRETGPQGVADESRLRVFLHQALPVLVQTVAACTRELQGEREDGETDTDALPDRSGHSQTPGTDDWITAGEADVFSLLFACADGHSVAEAFSRWSSERGGPDEANQHFGRNAFLTWLRRRLVWNDRLYPSRQNLAASCAFFSGAKRSQLFARVFVVAEVHGRRLVIDKESLGTVQPRDQVLIINCSECDIFLSAPVASVKMVNCSSASLICGRPIGGLLSLYNSQRLEVHAAAFLLQACNTLDAHLYVCSASSPLLCGDTRGIVLAPLDTPLSLKDVKRGKRGNENRPPGERPDGAEAGETTDTPDGEEEVYIFGRSLSSVATAFAFPLCGGGCGPASASSALASSFPPPPLPAGEGAATRCSSAGGRSVAGNSQIFQLLNPKNFNPISMPRPTRWQNARVASDVSQRSQSHPQASETQEKAAGVRRKRLDESEATARSDADGEDGAGGDAHREENLLALPEDFAEALYAKEQEVESLQEAMENMNLTDQQRETFFQILSLMLYDFCRRHSRRTSRLAAGHFARHEEVARSREASTGSIGC
uniref:Tubulin binding cofactor C domain-containing protein n=1 Tax=Neospora caninum (strain Liverpool) TaxID=572307 RepID=A0A0F7UMR5_NEOCL|nr:TPA: Tubulin binding cofactor C domain-containing protein [Neospora caninum Liverpool]